jgi:hypothetical protein
MGLLADKAFETVSTTILSGSGLQSWLDTMLINTKNISTNPIVIFIDLLCIHFPACGLLIIFSVIHWVIG